MPEPTIPTVDSLRSAHLVHRFGDLFNPPGLSNFVGSAQAALDVSAVRSLAFPPLAMGEMREDRPYPSEDVTTGVLFIDGNYALATGPIDYTWQPDRVDREMTDGNLTVHTATIVPIGSTAVLEDLRFTNTGTETRTVDITLLVRGNVTMSNQAWGSMIPSRHQPSTRVDVARGAVVFGSDNSGATTVQGCWPPPDRIDKESITYHVTLQPGEEWHSTFAVAMGADEGVALAAYDGLVKDFDAQAAHSRDEWNAELAAAFTPGNDRFSGHLPVLESDDPDLVRLYHTAVVSLLVHKRESQQAPGDTKYVTLGPRYWPTTTFLWDISLSSTLLALLDPKALKTMVEEWMTIDINQHFGTDFMTGDGVGPWYSVNDFAMCRMAREYLRWTGDTAWLDTVVAGKPVMEHLLGFATHWRSLDTNGSGLADYGGVDNLLEAVGSYTHEVAAMNAANVENLRFVADLLTDSGKDTDAQALRGEADRLAQAVQKLYVPGEGVWRCRMPDGSMHVVRHCYDFATVLTTMNQDLSQVQRDEMVGFFKHELMTPTWMRALSTRDHDVTFSVRPDHQWTGAYAAWPAVALSALYAAGHAGLAREWMHGLAKTMLQGPVAQAYFAEDVIPGEPGAGSRKAPSDSPWINDWSCVSGAAFLDPILYGLFGVRPPVGGTVTAQPSLAGEDHEARLVHLHCAGHEYTIDVAGAHLEPARTVEAKPPVQREVAAAAAPSAPSPSAPSPASSPASSPAPQTTGAGVA